ncbi:MAG: DNA methylase, partial [Cyanobacteria bacterium]|nr:DNA methylase [Cyanobacteriota bacterium]
MHNLQNGLGLTMKDSNLSSLSGQFVNEEERALYFRDKLREFLTKPGVRDSEGFPKGDIDAILNMSDPPYYTACPNPFLQDFVKEFSTPYDADAFYSRSPLAIDVSVGKTDTLYKAHGYHTKVPHQAIVPSILHYTNPGDVVLDAFGGSGMTGVAATFCGTAAPSYKKEVEAEFKAAGRAAPVWGRRRAIVNELSPAASSIAAGYNIAFSVDTFVALAEDILSEAEAKFGRFYEARDANGTAEKFDFLVWSEVFTCNVCSAENVFFDEAFDPDTGKVQSEFSCTGCGAIQSKEQMSLVFESTMSRVGRGVISRPRLVPVLLKSSRGRISALRRPSEHDIEISDNADAAEDKYPIPDLEFPDCQMTRVGRMATTKTRYIEDLLFKRSSMVIAYMWHRASLVPQPELRVALKYWLDSHLNNLSKLNRYRPEVSFPYNPLNGVYYVPSVIAEANPFTAYKNRLKRLATALLGKDEKSGSTIITTGDAANIPLPDSSVDYVFTDPPFGENIYYSDLNLFAEAWHHVYTDVKSESIIDRVREKDLGFYENAMQQAFSEMFRVLKPGRWMTVVFSNSKAAVWNAIQVSLQQAGFIVAEVTSLDKTQGSFKQVTSTTAVKQDLVVSCYKPNGGLEDRFETRGLTDETAWDFTRTHLKNLAVIKRNKIGGMEMVAERDARRLFDRMVAWFVRHNTPVPLSSAEYQVGLAERFPERDGMFFLPNQIDEYDKARMQGGEPPLRDLFVDDERTAIDWLTDFLKERPSTYQEVHPDFTQKTGAGWRKHELKPELQRLLDENFLKFDGNGPVPSQIHRYLSSNWKELRNLDKDDSQLVDKARNRWFVPDPNKQQDVEARRDKALLREFETYKAHKGKKMKEIRLEVMRVGFKAAWSAKDYRTIIDVSAKVPDEVWQEDER